MTAEEIKTYAKESYGLELTDREAADILNEDKSLADVTLSEVTGGISDEIAERSALSKAFREKRKRDLEEAQKKAEGKDRLA